jgi:hypothetical protein
MKRILPVVAIGAVLALFPPSVGAAASKRVIFSDTTGNCQTGLTSGTPTPSFAVIDFFQGNVGAQVSLNGEAPGTTYQLDLVQTPSGESCLQNPGEASMRTDSQGNARKFFSEPLLPNQKGVFLMLLTPFDILATTTVPITSPTPGWEGRVTNRASGCSARVQVPYLDGNQQVTAYTEVFCPEPTQLTVRSRLRSDYQFADITVAQRGCLGGSGCVIAVPKGFSFYRLSCPKSGNRRNNQRYYSDIVFYPGTNAGATTKTRSTGKFLSPFCAN